MKQYVAQNQSFVIINQPWVYHIIKRPVTKEYQALPSIQHASINQALTQTSA